ncbi:hypothetical protein, partial [Streptomyces anulatus]|uniref:hypothetical protein n=1 Tax=Streptomyces anulatus TaxID=1892 RepID=UPI0036500487
MTEMDEGGQEPVDEHEPVLRIGPHSTLSRPRSQFGLVTLVAVGGHDGVRSGEWCLALFCLGEVGVACRPRRLMKISGRAVRP